MYVLDFSLFFILCIFIFGSSSLYGKSSRKAIRVPVELEWEEIPGATLYELEFQNQAGKVISVVKSANHIFKFKFKVGSYQVRSRVADSRKVYGEWSELQAFQVQPRAISVNERTVSKTKALDTKTLLAPVLWRWEDALGALKFRVKIVNEQGKFIREEIVEKPFLSTRLPVGVYRVTVTSIGDDDIESEPISLPGQVRIEAIQLAQPIIDLEEIKLQPHSDQKVQRLPLKEGFPTLRLKGKTSAVQTLGILEYRYFFGDDWLEVDRFEALNLKELVLKKASKPGRYRLQAWSEAVGFKKSEITIYEFVIKPDSYEE